MRALRTWADDFTKSHGREPRLWLDCYCMYPAELELNIVSLPVYLALLSARMVVLVCGSFLTRLCCVVELSVFIEMGMSKQQVHVVLIRGGEERDGGGGDQLDAAAALCAAIERFDVREARCSHAEDRSILLNLIHQGFRGMDDELNTVVRRLVLGLVDDGGGGGMS
jgi:hypothetical protein